MVRTQILLKEHQHLVLKELSRQRGVSLSELVREAVDSLLQQEQRSTVERAKALLGEFAADRSDVAADHDRYLWGEDAE